MGLIQMAIQARFNQMLHGCAIDQAFKAGVRASVNPGRLSFSPCGHPPAPGISLLPPATSTGSSGESSHLSPHALAS